MAKLQIATQRLDCIDAALASMQRAAKQARERINDLTWPDISNLGRIAKEVEGAEWFWSGVNDAPPTKDPVAVAYVEMTSKATVHVVHIEGRIAYLRDGTQAWLRDLRLKRSEDANE